MRNFVKPLEIALLTIGILNLYHAHNNTATAPRIEAIPLAPSTTTTHSNECANKRNVISFALFNKNGNSAHFKEKDWLLAGIEANRIGWHFYLPDWVMRVYVGPGIPQQVIDKLIATADADPNFEIRQNISIQRAGNNYHQWMMHRFLVADDPSVKRFIVRDLDGRPSLREVLAINDWIRSGRPFHTIRDHQWHSKPVMGGMWGGTDRMSWRSRTTMRILIAKYIINHRGSFTDQDFLEEELWNRVALESWQHDIVPSRKYCLRSPDGCHHIPESVRWDEFFIGSPWKILHNDLKVTKTAATRQYECWSTCTMGPPIDCACTAKTFKSTQQTFKVPMQGTMT